jgi:hypothetical protein
MENISEIGFNHVADLYSFDDAIAGSAKHPASMFMMYSHNLRVAGFHQAESPGTRSNLIVITPPRRDT